MIFEPLKLSTAVLVQTRLVYCYKMLALLWAIKTEFPPLFSAQRGDITVLPFTKGDLYLNKLPPTIVHMDSKEVCMYANL